MRKYFLLLLLFTLAEASEISLKNHLDTAEPGSYLVTEQGKTCAFLYIREKSETHVTIEEVAIPASNFCRQKTSWRCWFETGASGHSIWTVSQINLKTGAFESTFSYTHQGWVDMKEANCFLATLLNLRFKEVNLEERKKVGLPPGYNKVDNRPLWTPRLIVDGISQCQTSFKVFKARWPKDMTDLSHKTIEIYLPDATKESAYPTFFPYWVEVEGKIGSAKMRVIDSGKGVHSPQLSTGC